MKKKSNHLAFGESNQMVFVCSEVFQQKRPILYVCREDGDWQFLCGSLHENFEQPHVVEIRHLVEHDPTLIEVAEVQENWEAERLSIEQPWKFHPCTHDL